MSETILKRAIQINNAARPGEEKNSTMPPSFTKCTLRANHAPSTVVGAEATAVSKRHLELLELTF